MLRSDPVSNPISALSRGRAILLWARGATGENQKRWFGAQPRVTECRYDVVQHAAAVLDVESFVVDPHSDKRAFSGI